MTRTNRRSRIGSNGPRDRHRGVPSQNVGDVPDRETGDRERYRRCVPARVDSPAGRGRPQSAHAVPTVADTGHDECRYGGTEHREQREYERQVQQDGQGERYREREYVVGAEGVATYSTLSLSALPISADRPESLPSPSGPGPGSAHEP